MTCTAAASTEPLPLEVVRAALQARLDDPARGGAAGGSINFASMSSLRGLPFAVVCAIGLNDGAFPGTARPLEFDLMARQPRRGDRKRRDDERGLMLDLLLAARHSLYLSHTGRSVRDNTPLPPSVLVAELLDLLVPAIAADPSSAAVAGRGPRAAGGRAPAAALCAARPSTNTAIRGCAATTASWPTRCAAACRRRAAAAARGTRRRRRS